MNKKLKLDVDDLLYQLHKQGEYHESRLEAVSKNWRYSLDAEYSRLSVVASQVDTLTRKVNTLEITNRNLETRLQEVEDLAKRLMGILERSGILEEAVEGNDLFQMQSTVDTLRRYPLYKINKVQIK